MVLGAPRGWILSFAGLEHSTTHSMSGHARFLAGPAHDRLESIERVLKRSIPVLIVIFLGVVFATRAISLLNDRGEIGREGQLDLSLIAAIAKSAVETARHSDNAPESGRDYEQLLFHALPEHAAAQGRIIVITSEDGSIIGSRGLPAELRNSNLRTRLSGAQPLFLFGQGAGVQGVELDAVPHLASFAKIGDRNAVIAVLQSEADLYSAWRKRVSLNVSLFVASSSLLIILLYAYFGQAARAKETDETYCEAQKRVDLALTRGLCGLWDWDLARGRIYWSRSMFELLGYAASEEVLSFGDVERLVHPEDVDLFVLAQKAAAQEIRRVDQLFRMCHADGNYRWMRIRTELVEKGSTGVHLIGIAVDVTEHHRLAAENAQANENLRAAIENTSESFALWDAQDRLVLCNSKFQEYNGLPGSELKPGTSRAEISNLMRAPISEKRIPSPTAGDDARVYERQIADGRWLQVNERRTASGGALSVGTDITQLKLHQERLMESERRLMATIDDLSIARKASQQKAGELEEAQPEVSGSARPGGGRQQGEIGFPGEHVARVADTAQRHHRLLGDTPVRNVRPTGIGPLQRICRRHSCQRHVPAWRHQRHSRHVEDRSRPHAA